jgi:hypothetical protein
MLFFKFNMFITREIFKTVTVTVTMTMTYSEQFSKGVKRPQHFVVVAAIVVCCASSSSSPLLFVLVLLHDGVHVLLPHLFKVVLVDGKVPLART